MTRPFIGTVVCLLMLFRFALSALSNEEMHHLASQSKNNIIQINDKNWEQIMSGPRDYHLVLMLSSESSQFNCVLCKEFRPHFEIVGRSWYEDHKNGIVEPSERDPHPSNVYFLYSEFFGSMDLFKAFKLTNIPRLFYFAPDSQVGLKLVVSHPTEYTFYLGDHKELIAEWLNDITSYKFNIYLRVNYAKVAQSAFITFAVVLLMFRFSLFFSKIFSSRSFWKGISLLLVLLFTSGYMFTQIRGTPFVVPGQAGPRYVVPSPQYQLGIETQILSLVYGGLAICVVSLIKNVPKVTYGPVKMALTIVISFGIYLIYACLLSIFGVKGYGYPYRFFLN